MNQAEMVVSIVNLGMEEKVIEVAKSLGVTGGTYINANGTGKFDAEKFFGLSINPEKVVVLLIIDSEKKEELLKALYNQLGLNSEAQGIAFSLPVDGMSDNLKNQLFKNNEKKD